ncbi:HDOD domain-containing protein [Oleiharenicola sp. Vm1]|uniref:HDOD domain-containing protein n=1 Tax=Oleiharenicola sp. Vm1 TaxID=3398393 RepID=UPI0039F53B19
MSSLSTPPVDGRSALDDQEIRRRINACPKLASLQANNDALSALVKSDQSLTSQIAEIIRRDPSLSARLLRMVNSVYFGLGARVNNIEEAVFFLGLRQIRELSVATPVIEELERLQGNVSTPLPWKDLWAHSIGCAILTREILRATPLSIDDDTDYLVGLLHNVGKVVMAYAFPDELVQISNTPLRTPAEVCRLERQLIGWDHAQIGAHYLQKHQVCEEIAMAVRYHCEPDRAPATDSSPPPSRWPTTSCATPASPAASRRSIPWSATAGCASRAGTCSTVPTARNRPSPGRRSRTPCSACPPCWAASFNPGRTALKFARRAPINRLHVSCD